MGRSAAAVRGDTQAQESEAGPAEAKTEVSGAIVNPNEQYSLAADYRLVGDTTFGWRTGQLPSDMDLNGHHFTMDTGGGNQAV